jgi:hypothetical protein
MAFKSVSDYLSEVILQIAGNKYRNYAQIRLRWQEIVGASVAANATPRNFDNGILKVSVKNNIWLQEMVLYKYKIISTYKKFDLPIKDIIFFLNSGRNHWGNE